MMYEISLKTVSKFLFRSAVSFLAAFAFTLLVIYGDAHFDKATNHFEYQQYSLDGQTYGPLITDAEQPQGADVRSQSVFVVHKAPTHVWYDDRVECIYPDGTRDLTRKQYGDNIYRQRMFSGFPDSVTPEGFEEKHRRRERSVWGYSWHVGDVPPVGSKCRMLAEPYTKTFFDLVELRHPIIKSNWFVVTPSQVLENIEK